MSNFIAGIVNLHDFERDWFQSIFGDRSRHRTGCKSHCFHEKRPTCACHRWALKNKIIRRYLLSHLQYYHRLRKLNYRVRNGSGVAFRICSPGKGPQTVKSDGSCLDKQQKWLSFRALARPLNRTQKRSIYMVKHSSISTG